MVFSTNYGKHLLNVVKNSLAKLKIRQPDIYNLL